MIDPAYLAPTTMIDSDHPSIASCAAAVAGDSHDPVATAVRLYYFVRDSIRYDPYYPFYKPECYRASYVLEHKRGYCVAKLSLLCALGRARGIPSRAGFANVRNHVATRQLLEMFGSNLFVWHGFTEFFLEGKWVKATPAFNLSLCERHRIAPLEFDGRHDSIFHEFNLAQQKFMQYEEFLGSFADIPVDRIVAGWKEAYGAERVQGWIDQFERYGTLRRDFAAEEVVRA